MAVIMEHEKNRKNETTGNFYLAFVGVKLSKYHFPKKEAAKAFFFILSHCY
jgi:dolichol kinase